MNSRQIFEDILLLDQSVTLSFPSKSAYINFRNSLYVIRKRLNERMSSLGMEDVADGKAIATQILSKSPTYTVTFSLTVPKIATTQYKILSIEPSNDSSTSS